MPQITWIWVAIAGALGALSRWGISKAGYALLGNGFAWGTLIANVLGCLLMGILMHLALNTDRIPEGLRTVLAIGFLGALTTFSTFSYETVKYIEDGVWMSAIVNIGGNVILGLGATLGGFFLARTFLGETA